MTPETLCTKCHAEPYDPMWDFGEDEKLCQGCWEDECSESWWKGVDEGWIF